MEVIRAWIWVWVRVWVRFRTRLYRIWERCGVRGYATFTLITFYQG